MKLFSVERRTQPMRRGNKQRGSVIHYSRYAIMAEDADKARAIAEKRCPQDELDGPTVVWDVVEEDEPIVFCRDGVRRVFKT